MAQLDVILILDQAIERVRAGEPVERVLATYPLAAAELRPMLALSADLEALPTLEPDPATSARHFEAMMAAFDEETARRPGGVTWWGWLATLPIFPSAAGRPWPRLARALALVVLAVVISGGWVVSAAADTVPGDRFYPVKRTVEAARLSLVRDEAARQTLQDRFNQERLAEIDTLQDLGRAAEVEFTARIDRLEQDVWLVDDVAIVVSDQTDLAGLLAVGQPAVVRARLDRDGTLTALVIRGRGEVDTVPALPSATPTPTATQTRVPVIRETTPTRDVVPTATPTARPTRTPVPPREASPTAEPIATHRPTDRPTQQPTQRPQATATRDAWPTSTVQPHPTAAPTRDKPPTAEPTPPPVDVAPTAKPTSEPQPTVKPTARPQDHPPTPTPQRSDGGDGRSP